MSKPHQATSISPKIVFAVEDRELLCERNGSEEIYFDTRYALKKFGSVVLFGAPAKSAIPLASEATGIFGPWITELPHGFAEKVRRHAAMIALLFTYHNYATQTSKGVSPAMTIGLTDHVWSLNELLRISHRPQLVVDRS